MRVPTAMRDSLHRIALERGYGSRGFETFVTDVLTEFVNGLSRQRPQSVPGSDDLLVWRFLVNAPCAVAIKNKRGGIEWANPAYEALVGHELDQIRNSSHVTLALVSEWDRDDIQNDIDRVFKTSGQTYSLETMSVHDGASPSPIPRPRVRRVFATYRWWFRAVGADFLGDLSFDWAAIVPGRRTRHYGEQKRIGRSKYPTGLNSVVREWFDRCPVAMAIKDLTTNVVRVNQAFCELRGVSKAEEVLDMTTAAIWNLDRDNEVTRNELEVAQFEPSDWAYYREEIPSVGLRVSLRFRIRHQEEGIDHVGVVSTDFKRERHQGAHMVRSSI